MIDKPVTMFGGKGGVGKTTCAAATALHYAREGFNTLIISTDPMPSLSDIFENRSQDKPVPITRNLYLIELGIEEVKRMWDARFGREVYEVFSAMVSIGYEEFVDFITSILPGLQEEFMVDYIRELVGAGTYQRVVWDTAPLGQTMNLLAMPRMLHDHLKPAPRIYSRLKPGGISKRPVLKILADWVVISARDEQFLKTDVDYNLVTIPEALAVQQIEGVLAEFAQHQFHISRVIVNNVIQHDESDFLQAKRAQQRGYLERIHALCSRFSVTEVPLFPYEIKGIERVAEVERVLFTPDGTPGMPGVQ